MLILVGLFIYLPTLQSNRVLWLFNGLVNGLLSLITIILTINQLILSRQFGSPADLYERFESRLDFRQRVEEGTGSIMVLPDPSGFIRLLFLALRGRAVALANESTGSEQVDHDIENCASTVIEQTDGITTDLAGSRFEMEGLLTVLNYDDTWQFYVIRRFQILHGPELSDTAIDLLEEIRELLKETDTTRQYFKTLYLRRELAQLSRRAVGTGIGAIIAASLPLLVYRNNWTVTMGQTPSLIIIAILIALTLAPVSVLFSYALPLGNRHTAYRGVRPVRTAGRTLR